MNKPNEIYVDYALHNKVGIYCNEPYLRMSFKPITNINYQIEGEALAIKCGLKYFLEHRKNQVEKLIIYTDNKTLLRPFRSRTQAGGWWWKAQAIAKKNNIYLELKFIAGKENPADLLTRDYKQVQNQKERSRYYYQEWLKTQKSL